MKLLINRVECLKCGDIITSTHRHDWVSCKCGSIYTDGGRDYIRRGGDPDVMKDLSVYEKYEDIDEEIYIYFTTCMQNNNKDVLLSTVETSSHFGEDEEFVTGIITKFGG